MHYDSPSSALHYDALCVGWANDIFILKALPLKSIALSLPFIFGNQIHHLYLRANWLDWKLWQHINLDLLQIILIFWDRFCFKDQHLVLWVLWCSGNFFISSACSSLRSNGGDNGAVTTLEKLKYCKCWLDPHISSKFIIYKLYGEPKYLFWRYFVPVRLILIGLNFIWAWLLINYNY